ncbi:hypothetical protein [Streptosporangium sp. NPDC051022]|uniref:hypothetical protein n=1 Tax=Streptosporangium sp. NPDC051022 TaxID=3155752 RepID=UPI0034183360
MAFGMEVEVARPVLTPDKKNFAGDTEILQLPFVGKLVSDYRLHPTTKNATYSNAEFVLAHFDQHAGSETEAKGELEARLAILDSLVDDLYEQTTDELLKTLISAKSTKRYTEFLTARIDSAAVKTYQLKHVCEALVAPQTVKVPAGYQLLIHYTIGIPPDRLAPALTQLAKLTRQAAKGNNIVEHAAKAEAVAKKLAKLLPTGAVKSDQVDELVGFLALVFVQAAAFADIVENSPGGTVVSQPKNFVAALSRVPLQTVFNGLHPDVRSALKGKAALVWEKMGDDIIGAFNDDDSRKLDSLPKITIKDYVMSAFGHGAVVAQARVFGGMNETGLDPSVHSPADPDPKTGRGVPVELRAVGVHHPDWDVFLADARKVFAWSRGLASANPKERSTDHWLGALTARLVPYETAVGRLPGSGAGTAERREVLRLCQETVEVIDLYPGFPFLPRATGWKPADLAALSVYRRFIAANKIAAARLKGFPPDPFAGSAFDDDMDDSESEDSEGQGGGEMSEGDGGGSGDEAEMSS